MPVCIVKLCKNNTTRNKKHTGITFHQFPSDPALLQRWTAVLRLSRQENWWTPGKRSVICSEHFNENDFYYTNRGLKRLCKGTEPKNALFLCGITSGIYFKSEAESVPSGPVLASEDEDSDSDGLIEDPSDISDFLVFNDRRDSSSAQNQPGASSTSAQYQTSRYSMVEGNLRSEDAALEEIIIKEEITEEEKSQCRLCLSVGRKMKELNEYAVLYRKLLFENNYQNSTIPSFMFEMLACWECIAELRRVRRFQQRVRRANAAFESNQNQNCGNLSNLSFVLIGEKKTPRPDENLSSIEHCVQNIKEEACEIDIEETALPDPLDVHQEPISSEDKIVIEVPSVQTAIKTQTTQAKTTHKSVKRAAAETKIAKDNPKRAKIEQNVPKAEVSEDNNPKSIEPVDSDEIFGKVKIEFEELQRILEDRRNKESFKSMKYKCDSCVLGFTDYNRLQEHNTSFHDEEVGSCSCDICDRRFDDDRQLSAHYRNHFVKFVCILCDFECYTKTGRMIHFKRHKSAIQGGDPDTVLRERLSQASVGGSSRS
ncbi:uncharacterized protein LOC120635656 isoform X3 [Pararge aegeria]|uniref:uncharacterized protein LOC120635656 isoform X3 n=1 Tax=Pararge aegeria TaxID=116150 RepID=UPI0019D169ED|nr:uncharacterized protein LOC120635656 isoform X3 [Pararge aegeria]